MENEVIYNVEKIESIAAQMRTLISNSQETVVGLSVPPSMIGETRTKLDEIVTLYGKLYSTFSEDLVNKLTDYATQKSSDMTAADNQ